jgi:hypothetical protein
MHMISREARRSALSRRPLALALLALIASTLGFASMSAQTPPVQLVVKLKPSIEVNIDRGRFVAPSKTRGVQPPREALTRLNELVGQPLVTSVHPLIGASGQRSASEPQLSRYYAVNVKPGASAQDVEQLRARLASQEVVEQVYVAPTPEDPKAGSTAADPGVPSTKPSN